MNIKKLNWFLSGSSTEPPAIQVTFQQAGTGSALASVGDLTPSYPVTGVQEGDIFFCHAAVRNLTTVFKTPTGWTLVGGQPDTNNAGNSWLFYKVATGSESGNLTLTTIADATDVKLARIYRFRGAAGSLLFGANTLNNGSGSTTLSAPTVVGTQDLGLAICFTYEADNNSFADFSGETGGDWAQPVAQFATSLGSDSILAIHTATMATAGTISGGSTTMAASASWNNRAFVLYRTSIAAESVRSGRLYGISLSQSNGNGQASVSDIAATGRTELLSVIPRSYVWWEGTNGVRWQPLQAGVNANTLGTAFFGPIISMAYAEHLKYPNVDKFYVIHAVGGSSMTNWLGATGLHNFFKAKYDAAMEYLTPTDYVGVATFHGETDAASAPGSAAYEANEATGMTELFAETSFTRAFVLQLHNFLPIGTFPHKAVIMTAKTNNAGAGTYGTGGGLGTAPTGSVIQADNVHFNALGVINAGDNISAIMP